MKFYGTFILLSAMISISSVHLQAQESGVISTAQTAVQKIGTAINWVIDSRVVNAAAKIGGLCCMAILLQKMASLALLGFDYYADDATYVNKQEWSELDKRISALHARINFIEDAPVLQQHFNSAFGR